MIKVLMLVSNLRAANGVASFAINYYKNLVPVKSISILPSTKIDLPLTMAKSGSVATRSSFFPV